MLLLRHLTTRATRPNDDDDNNNDSNSNSNDNKMSLLLEFLCTVCV